MIKTKEVKIKSLKSAFQEVVNTAVKTFNEGKLNQITPLRNVPIIEKESPLDVKVVDLGVSTDEIVEIIRESREKEIY